MRGGKRKGAGRKSSGRVRYQTRLKPKVILKIETQSKKQKISQPEYLETLITQTK